MISAPYVSSSIPCLSATCRSASCTISGVRSPSEFDDYIAAPKDNFYQSLHTALLDKEGKTIEIQIRTREMHVNAEYGIAAHWRYKEGGRDGVRDPHYEERLNFIRRLMEFGSELPEDDENFLNTMKTEVFEGRVYVFTPKGDILDLPAGATPIDLAYHIHTEVGHHCRGAKVLGNLVNLNYRLQNADQVEILTSQTQQSQPRLVEPAPRLRQDLTRTLKDTPLVPQAEFRAPRHPRPRIARARAKTHRRTRAHDLRTNRRGYSSSTIATNSSPQLARVTSTPAKLPGASWKRSKRRAWNRSAKTGSRSSSARASRHTQARILASGSMACPAC